MSIPRDHHFIPAFYLRQWCDHTGKLIEYTIKHGKLISKPVGPNATGYEFDLYAFPELPLDQSQFINKSSSTMLIAVRESGRGPTRLGTLSRVLFRLRDIGVGNLRGTEPELHCSGAGRLGSDCRDTRLLHAIFPVLSYRCPDPDSLHTALLRGSGDAVRRPLVPLSDIRCRRGLVHTACQRRYSLVGPHRGLHRRRHSRGSVAASAPPAMAARRRWRHPGFCSLRDCLRRIIITRRIS